MSSRPSRPSAALALPPLLLPLLVACGSIDPAATCATLACEEQQRSCVEATEEAPAHCGECTAGTYADGGACVAASACAEGTYEQAAPTATTDRVCSPITACGENEYEATAPTPTTDRACAALRVCDDTQVERVEVPTDGSALEDRHCCATVAGPLTIVEGSGWPEYEGQCFRVVGDVSIVGDPGRRHVPLVGVSGSLEIEATPAADLQWLSWLQTVGNDLSLQANESLATLGGLESLERVGRDLSIQGNPALTTIRQLSGITELRTLRILDNPLLETLEGPRPTALEVLEVASNATLFDLRGLEDLEVVRSVLLTGNERLQATYGLGPLSSMDRTTVAGNPALRDVLFMRELTDAVEIHIKDNPSLWSVELGALSVAMNIRILDNHGLTLIDLRSLVSTDRLWIVGQDRQPLTLSIPRLRRATSELALFGNHSFTQFGTTSPLQLEEVGILTIAYNVALRRLPNLGGTLRASHVEIHHNNLLCQPYVDAFVDHISVTGNTVITPNGAC